MVRKLQSLTDIQRKLVSGFVLDLAKLIAAGYVLNQFVGKSELQIGLLIMGFTLVAILFGMGLYIVREIK